MIKAKYTHNALYSCIGVVSSGDFDLEDGEFGDGYKFCNDGEITHLD